MDDVIENSQGWCVHLSVSADDGQALLGIVPQNFGEHGASLVASAGSELKELVLFSRESDGARARDAVVDDYQRLRRVAGLHAEPAMVVSLERPARRHRSPHALFHTVMREATRVLRTGSNFEWAVVLAQTACEVLVLDILKRGARKRGVDAIGAVEGLSGTNLASPRVRQVFVDVIGHPPPEGEQWWRDYQTHAQRRHRIVHGGARITRKDAEASIAAAQALIEFLHGAAAYVDAQPD